MFVAALTVPNSGKHVRCSGTFDRQAHGGWREQGLLEFRNPFCLSAFFPKTDTPPPPPPSPPFQGRITIIGSKNMPCLQGFQ